LLLPPILQKNLSVRIVLLLLSTASLLFSSCNSFMIPEYKEFRNFKIEKLGFSETTVSMDLVYLNDNRIGFQVRRTEADIYVDGVYLGRAVSDTLIRVAKKSDFIIPMQVKTDMKNLYKNAWSALSNKTVLVKARGTITAGVAGVFKTIPLDYEGRHEMTLFEP
jgi:LEA14-like dessication related protein